jgi:WD40 repeat protein
MMRYTPLALALLATACSHESPSIPGVYTPNQPAGTGALVRVTFNPGDDLWPSWLPDGRGFLYTAERIDRDDLDRCLAQLPAAGGTIEREICDLIPAAADSVNAYTAAAVSSDGRVAYVRATASLAVGWPVAPFAQQLVVAPMDHPDRARVLQTIPYPGPSGRIHQSVSQVSWLGDSTLVFVGQKVDYPAVCSLCSLRDTLTTGLEVVQLDFSGPAPALTMLPGTDQASSVTAAGDDTVYFTVNGDSRVFRLQVSSGALSTAHDFGAGNIARDVGVAAGRLVAVVGGKVSFGDDPALGLVQRDSGGTVVVVELAGGAETALTPPLEFYRHAALAPDGRHIVAERLLGRTTDLYLVEVP